MTQHTISFTLDELVYIRDAMNHELNKYRPGSRSAEICESVIDKIYFQGRAETQS